MEFIKIEQFSEEPKEVQQAILDWFNCISSNYDLIQIKDRIMLYKDFINREPKWVNYDSYPLLTMQHLIQLIEDASSKKVIFEYTCCGNIAIKLLSENRVNGSLECTEKHTIPKDKFTLLEAFWNVAIKIVKREVV